MWSPMKALVVIDVQNGVYREEGVDACEGERVVAAINGLVAAARQAGSPVVFVQHEDDHLLRGSEESQLLSALDARADDASVYKRHGSAFHGTTLADDLRSQGIGQVVLCGLQTEYCVDSTFRHAVALGFAVELAEDAHTTFDSAMLPAARIIDHHNTTLRGYGDVVPAAEIVFPAGDD